MRVLGIETSCDETAAAIVERDDMGEGRILSNVVLSQIAEHEPYGGVVPEIAARAHVEALDRLVDRALNDAGLKLYEVDAVAATAGPGLIGGLIVGLMTAKALAMAAQKPFYAVNHLEGHALTARLTDGLPFPYLLLLVSGGHTQMVLVRGIGDYERLGTTIDDALGEAFDKTAKLLGLPYPGGPTVERMALQGDQKRFALPRPLKGEARLDFPSPALKPPSARPQPNWCLSPIRTSPIYAPRFRLLSPIRFPTVWAARWSVSRRNSRIAPRPPWWLQAGLQPTRPCVPHWKTSAPGMALPLSLRRLIFAPTMQR